MRNIGHWGFWVGRECNSILEQKLTASLTCLLWGHNISGPSTQNMSWMELWIFTKNLWNFSKNPNWGNDSFSPCSARKHYKHIRLGDVLSLPLVEYFRDLQATCFIPVILRKLLNANKHCFTYTCQCEAFIFSLLSWFATSLNIQCWDTHQSSWANSSLFLKVFLFRMA